MVRGIEAEMEGAGTLMSADRLHQTLTDTFLARAEIAGHPCRAGSAVVVVVVADRVLGARVAAGHLEQHRKKEDVRRVRDVRERQLKS